MVAHQAGAAAAGRGAAHRVGAGWRLHRGAVLKDRNPGEPYRSSTTTSAARCCGTADKDKRCRPTLTLNP